MRDKRFVAVHRGGPLTKDNHRKLIKWARMCSEHVASLLNNTLDKRLVWALQMAEEWESSHITVGIAIKAALRAHAAARESTNLTSALIARSIGHAVATAHMADHAVGAALYALKAVKQAGLSVDKEREWQHKQLYQLPPEIVELVLTTMSNKEKSLKIE